MNKKDNKNLSKYLTIGFGILSLICMICAAYCAFFVSYNSASEFMFFRLIPTVMFGGLSIWCLCIGAYV